MWEILLLDFLDVGHYAAVLFSSWTNEQASVFYTLPIYPSFYLYLIFLNLYLTKLIFELDFVYLLCISHLIFTACVACKNQVPN